VSRPTLTIIAGANGAGKSTLTAGSPGTLGAIPLLDPDAFANIIHRELGVYVLHAFCAFTGPELVITHATAISGSKGLRFMSWLRNSKAANPRSIQRESP
jgi:hypothetical protein